MVENIHQVMGSAAINGNCQHFLWRFTGFVEIQPQKEDISIGKVACQTIANTGSKKLTEQELADLKTRLRDIAEPRLRHLLIVAEELEQSSDPAVRAEAVRQIRAVVEWLAGRVA